jgi:hypothetical protein
MNDAVFEYEKQTFVIKLLDPFCICRQNTGNVYFFELNENPHVLLLC